MTEYRVVTQKYSEIIDDKLTECAPHKYTRKEGPEDSIAYIWKCSKKEREETLEYIAHVVSDVVQEKVIKKFVQKHLKQCIEFSREEKQQISEMFITTNYFSKEEGVSYLSYYLVYMPILHMLQEKKTINVEGWICFRTEKYRLLLQDILEQMICDFKIQKDYMNFLDVLITSKNLETSEQESIHLIPDQYGEIHILDEDKEEATWKYIYEYCSDMLEDEIIKEDLFMNILLSISPKKIYIHKKSYFYNKQFINTVEKVFYGQIQYCEGCKYCQVKEDTERY